MHRLTNNGFANGADYENFRKLLATASKGNFSFQASSSTAEKGIPTGAFGTLFNDNRQPYLEWPGPGECRVTTARSDRGSLSARVFGGHSTVRGAFASDASLPPNQSTGLGDWWGADIDAARTFSRHFLTVGGEFQDNYKQNQKNYDTDPYMVY